MTALQNFKCPCCDGAIEFDSTAQKMVCPYCGTDFAMSDMLAYDEALKTQPEDDMQWDSAAGQQWQPGETEGMRIYTCNTCSGEIVADEVTGATECPFCGNPVVMTGQFKGDLKPDLLIPFKLDKKAAIAALEKHYFGKKLLPKVFKDQNHIKEVKGVYVPFWVFSGEAEGQVQYKASRVRLWSDSNYNYAETSFFNVTRGGGLTFDNIPVDGSTKMDDTLMESIEPFNMAEAVDFQAAYLSGYLADRYDVDAEASIQRANERVKKSTEQAFTDSVRSYNTVTPVSTNIKLNNSTAKYVLCPVWLLNTRWGKKNYTFAMNAQTGKLVGDLPVDSGARTRRFLGALALGSVLAFAAQYLLWML